MHETMYKPPASLLAAHRADGDRSASAAGSFAARCTTSARTTSAACRRTPGLFSTAHDLTRFAQMYLNGGDDRRRARCCRASEIAIFTTRQVQDRALGWQKPDGNNSARPPDVGARLRAHRASPARRSGSTRTRDMFIILLTNRVNPTRANTKIGRVRVQLADAVMSHACSTGSAHLKPDEP